MTLQAKPFCSPARRATYLASPVSIRPISRMSNIRVAAGGEGKQQQGGTEQLRGNEGTDARAQQQRILSQEAQEDLPRLTTWQYGKTKDPGLVTYYMVAAFLVPILLVLAPLISSPPTR